MDPPRKDCDDELLKTIIAMKPKRLAYVSCNLGILSKNLKTLSESGFSVKEVQPIDMFPQT